MQSKEIRVLSRKQWNLLTILLKQFIAEITRLRANEKTNLFNVSAQHLCLTSCVAGHFETEVSAPRLNSFEAALPARISEGILAPNCGRLRHAAIEPPELGRGQYITLIDLHGTKLLRWRHEEAQPSMCRPLPGNVPDRPALDSRSEGSNGSDKGASRERRHDP
ncbi:hypothetical protein D3C86_891710 [compost metagenome]